MRIYGPYLRKDGRKHIVIINDDGSRRTKSYPRFLMENHIGRELLEEETVDHINEDFTDDRIENLRILSRSENARIAVKPAVVLVLICKFCGKEFLRRKSKENRRVKANKDGPYCSHRCNGKVNH